MEVPEEVVVLDRMVATATALDFEHQKTAAVASAVGLAFVVAAMQSSDLPIVVVVAVAAVAEVGSCLVLPCFAGNTLAAVPSVVVVPSYPGSYLAAASCLGSFRNNSSAPVVIFPSVASTKLPACFDPACLTPSPRNHRLNWPLPAPRYSCRTVTFRGRGVGGTSRPEPSPSTVPWSSPSPASWRLPISLPGRKPP